MSTLYLVSTPIGNLDDITIRAIKTLLSVEIILCEDTRRTGRLINNIELRIQNRELKITNKKNTKKAKLISFYDEIEEKRIPEIVNFLKTNHNIALVSDSGTPLVSDPGFKLVRKCIEENIKIVSIPGPSSILAALTMSALPTNQFLFFGYLPKKQSKQQKLLEDLKNISKTTKNINPTYIFFATPHKLQDSLTTLRKTFGNINIVIARELTKMHEEVWRGKIEKALDNFKNPKGEFVLLFNLKD